MLEIAVEVYMNIENFSLSWRWTNSSHAMFSKKLLSELHPLSIKLANQVADSIPDDIFIDGVRFNASDEQLTIHWLKEIKLTPQRVTISWDRDTALNLPWSVFCEYWDDFCYPSSDDVNILLGNGKCFLRWHHYEVFEFDEGIL